MEEDNLLEKAIQPIAFQRYFFVDYENVHCCGLNGISNLTENDCVKIYYSDSAQTLTFGLHRRIGASKAHFSYCKIHLHIKNALDCKILYDIGEVIKENKTAEIFIVSKDSDFDKDIEEFKIQNIRVKRILEICKMEETPAPIQIAQQKEQLQKPILSGTSPKEKREAQIRSCYDKYCKKKFYIDNKEEIIRILVDSTSRQQVNNRLIKLSSGSKEVKTIYKTIQPFIKDLPGK